MVCPFVAVEENVLGLENVQEARHEWADLAEDAQNQLKYHHLRRKICPCYRRVGISPLFQIEPDEFVVAR